MRCADESLYTGITTDLARRVDEHNGLPNSSKSLGARYTRSRRPVELIYQENCQDRSSASQRESQIKRLSRAEKLDLINGRLNVQ